MLARPFLSSFLLSRTAYLRSNAQSISFPYFDFNQPVSNNTDHDLDPTYNTSWQIDVVSTLASSTRGNVTEAEMAFAPHSNSESASIPTLILQERADGLLRVEYFAQNWPHTYGLVLYNSTSPGWTSGVSVSLIFKSFGPPATVNPQIAPRSNGNLDISIGGATVVSAYPIAWASLEELYVYGYPGSSFVKGTCQISFYGLSQA